MLKLMYFSYYYYNNCYNNHCIFLYFYYCYLNIKKCVIWDEFACRRIRWSLCPLPLSLHTKGASGILQLFPVYPVEVFINQYFTNIYKWINSCCTQHFILFWSLYNNYRINVIYTHIHTYPYKINFNYKRNWQ